MSGNEIRTRRLTAAVLLSVAAVAGQSAGAQDLVMRRPLPETLRGQSTDQSTPISSPTPTPSGATKSCANGSTANAFAAAWTSDGWTNAGAGASASCTAQTKTFYCVASFVCPGETPSSQIEPDSVCQNFAGSVSVVDPDA